MVHTQFLNNIKIKTTSLQEQMHFTCKNTYCEVEGAAVGFIVYNHLQEKIIVASNDIDVLFYCMIAADNIFVGNCVWVKCCRVKNIGISMNKFTTLKNRFSNIDNPVLSVIVYM